MNTVALVTEQPSTEIVEFSQFEFDLAEYKEKYSGVVYDMTVKSVEKQARSDRHAIGTKIAELDRVHAAVKAPLKAHVDLLDGERKRIKDGLKEVQDGIKSQIEAHEAKLQAIEDGLQAMVTAIDQMVIFTGSPTSEQVMDRLIELGAIVVDSSYAHYQDKALTAHAAAQALLHDLFATVSQAEVDAEELKRLREEEAARAQREREDHIAKLAAEKARLDAEAKAQHDKANDEAALKLQREAERLALQQAEHRAAEAERLQQQAEDRARQVEEQAKAAIVLSNAVVEKALQEHEDRELSDEVKVQIVNSIAEHGRISLSAANNILVAIMENKIQHIGIC